MENLGHVLYLETRMSSTKSTIPREAQPASRNSYTVNSWPLRRLAVGVVCDEVGSVSTPRPRGALATCCSLPAPNLCADIFEDLRRATSGVRRQRDARALEMGGRVGLRLGGAFCETPRCRGMCSCEGLCRSRLGEGGGIRWGGRGGSMLDLAILPLRDGSLRAACLRANHGQWVP